MSERHFNEMITSHTELLANTVESIRRELLPVAILASNYGNEARKFHNELHDPSALFPFPNFFSFSLLSSSVRHRKYDERRGALFGRRELRF